jgi:hypothetical protein
MQHVSPRQAGRHRHSPRARPEPTQPTNRRCGISDKTVEGANAATGRTILVPGAGPNPHYHTTTTCAAHHATRPPGMNSLQQQARFDDFVHEFNAERPHEAIAMKCPAEVYTSSRRPYQGLPDLEFPFHDRDVLVTACGRICIYRKKINISTVLAGQRLGIKQVDEGIWLVTFIDYDLGYIDLEQRTLQPIDNPFGPRLSPMS